MNWETFNKYVNTKAIVIFILLALIFIAILFTICNKNRDILIEKFEYPSVLATNADYPTFNQDESKIYFFDKNSRKLQTINLEDNKVEILIDKTFDDLYSIIWSRSANFALVNTSVIKIIDNVPDYDSTQYTTSSTLVNIETGAITKIPSTLENISWSPDEKLIVYSLPDDDLYTSFSVYLANSDGTNPRVLKKIDTNGANLKVIWSKEKELLILKPYYNPPETADMDDQNKMSLFYRLNLTTNDLTKINGDKIADFTVSPNGKTIITASEDDINLGIINDSKPEVKIENFPFSSFASVYWAKNSSDIYSLTDNTTPEDKPNLVFSLLDLTNLNVINMNYFSFKTAKLAPRYADQLLINEKKQTAYFVADGVLYKVTFKKARNH